MVAELLADVEPATVADAEWAAHRWRAGDGVSLADRLRPALAATTGCRRVDR